MAEVWVGGKDVAGIFPLDAGPDRRLGGPWVLSVFCVCVSSPEKFPGNWTSISQAPSVAEPGDTGWR